MTMVEKTKSERNKTLDLTETDIKKYTKNLLKIDSAVKLSDITNKTLNQDTFEALDYLPDNFVDLIVVDPPYNLTKKFNENTFKQTNDQIYTEWVESWISKLPRIMTNTSSIYVCCDWKSSSAIYQVLSKYFIVRNRITWEREKGRGAKSNWKNCSEDIWFATKSNDYFFDPDRVKIKKKVIAPYKNEDGKPKDWKKSEDGNYRFTFPSNLWTDITIPFWSMPENTEHPTQKPEKLIAKLILASSQENDFIFDPFLGSGTTSVVAKKLNRNFCGIEFETKYALLAEKRLDKATNNKTIQGFFDGIFWDRNSLNEQKIQQPKKINKKSDSLELFEMD